MTLSLFMAGCNSMLNSVTNAATNQRDKTFNDVMQSKVGMSEFDLISSWGAPDKSYSFENGSKMISYDGAVSNGLDGLLCTHKFLIENQKVTKWGMDGACLDRSTRTADKLPNNTPIPRPTLN